MEDTFYYKNADDIMLCFCSGSGSISTLSRINVINNTISNGCYGYIHINSNSGSTLTIRDSCFYGNTNKLFDCYSGELVASNIYCDFYSETTRNNKVKTSGIHTGFETDVNHIILRSKYCNEIVFCSMRLSNHGICLKEYLIMCICVVSLR